jgi:hypothetical protein
MELRGKARETVSVKLVTQGSSEEKQERETVSVKLAMQGSSEEKQKRCSADQIQCGGELGRQRTKYQTWGTLQ